MENMNKNQFLMLCDALAKETITKEQLKQILSGNFSFEKVRAIIEILQYKELTNKDQIFPKLLEQKDEEIEKTRKLLACVLYRTDTKRLEYMLDNLQNKGFTLLRKIVTEDFIWKNKELLELLTQEIERYEHGRTIFIENLKELEEINPEVFDNPEFIPMVKKTLKLSKLKYSLNCLSYIPLKCVQEKQEWLDYTIMYYNCVDEDKLPYGKYTLAALEECDLMEYVNKKLDEIKKMEITKEEAALVFKDFLTNLETIKNEWLGLDEIMPYIQEVIDYALTESPNYFPYLGELIMIESPAEKLSIKDKILPLYEGLKRIRSPKVREATLEFLNTDALTPEMLILLRTANEKEAQTIFLQQAINNNNLEYQKTQKYFEEFLPEEFITYMEELDFTTEELLQIRDRVQSAPLEFKENTLYVDTTDIIPDNFQQKEIPAAVQKINPTTKKKALNLGNAFTRIFKGKDKNGIHV